MAARKKKVVRKAVKRKVTKKAGKSLRSCSLCGKPGHNARTCPNVMRRAKPKLRRAQPKPPTPVVGNCEGCGAPATTYDNPESMVPLCAKCKDELDTAPESTTPAAPPLVSGVPVLPSTLPVRSVVAVPVPSAGSEELFDPADVEDAEELDEDSNLDVDPSP